MKIPRRSVESKQYKRTFKKFYQSKIKPFTLSMKHFFKSSLIFFKNHPRLKTCSIVASVFILVVIVSAIVNTFSKNLLTANIDYAKYDEHVDEFWHKLSRDGDFERPSESISYKTIDDTTGTCNINISTLTYDHNLTVANDCYMDGSGTASDPYLVTTIQQFMFARNLGKTDSNGKYFKLMENLDFTGFALPVYDNSSKSGLFSGNFDGNFKHIKGLTYANTTNKVLETIGLFPAIEGNSSTPAVVKNFILDDATFSINGNYNKGITAFGALVGLVGPYSYVYNNGLLSGSISASGLTGSTSLKDGVYIGSLYGFYTDFEYNDTYKTSRQYNSLGNTKGGIFNSYSYANMNISGTQSGTVKFGGVLGYRLKDVKAINNDNSSYFMNGKNSLFILNNYYGKITANGNADYQFVYNGAHAISSSISPHMSYFWFKGLDRDITIDAQSYAIAEDADYLQSDGFAANLNSYRDVMNFYFKDTWESNSPVASALSADFADTEWYISDSDFGNTRPYFPILRKKVSGREHSSNNDGTLSVTFDANGHGTSRTLSIPISNQDEVIDDYVYHKIELPFAIDTIYQNKWTNGNYIMTFNGWKLTSVNGSSISSTPSALQYDMTLRTGGNGKAKDVNNIYAEGGYYLVPDGVTNVTFQAVWAYTIYVSDEYNQASFDAVSYRYRNDSGYGAKFGSHSGLREDSPATSMATAYSLAASTPDHSDLYHTVIMLVGNYHYSPTQTGSNDIDCDWFVTNANTPVTIKSIDNDNDKKPDYSLYIRNLSKMFVGSVRFDFINVLGIPQVAGYSGMLGAFFLNDGVSFEVSETAVTDHITLYMQNANLVKILGGYYDIYNNYDVITTVSSKYMIFGGTAKTNTLISTSVFDEQAPDGVPNENGRIINVTGGIIKFLSYDIKPSNLYFGNIYFYIDGGYIDEFYSLYLGQSELKVYVTINNAYVNNCYGGGFADTSWIKKGITFRINNSRIGTIYGGPKYGTVASSLDIIINDSELNYVYGGGYGGTEYFTIPAARYVNTNDNVNVGKYYNTYTSSNSVYTLWLPSIPASMTGGREKNKSFKVVDYKSKVYSHNGVKKTSVDDILAYLSLSSAPKITFSVSNSKVNHDIYGGGNRGVVTGDIRFELYNVTVMGSIFGAGVSSATDTVKVNTSGSMYNPPFFNYAIDNEYQTPTTTEYTWLYDSSYSEYGTYTVAIDTSGKTIQTAINKELGLVEAGDIYINLSGDDTGKYPMYVDHDVYGGGDKSNVRLTNEIHLNINDGVHVHGNVYGGGNLHDVTANTNVIVENYDMNNQTVIDGGVYAAGNNANVIGSATVTIAGNPKINNVFGGGNMSSATESNVYIEGGDIENVYGGSDNSGVVDTSHVFIGKKSPKEKTNGYVREFDFCGDKAFNFEIVNNNSSNDPTGFRFRNLTNLNFDEYKFTITLADSTVQYIGNHAKDGWTNGTNYASYSNGVITIDHNRQYYNPGDTYTEKIPFNSGNYIRGDLHFNGLTGINYVVVSISFTGYDFDGNIYEFQDCAVSNLMNNTRFVRVENEGPHYTQTKLGNIKVANVFGGNNVGGKTLSPNILVLGNGTNSQGTPYTVQVGNVYGGGNKTVTGNAGAGQKALILLDNANVTGSVYGGGAGDENDGTGLYDATMYAQPHILVTNNSTIAGSVFGGGYAADADVGAQGFPVTPWVMLDSCTIAKNVYGGGFGDVIWGGTTVYTSIPGWLRDIFRDQVYFLNNTSSPFYGSSITSYNSNTTVSIGGTVFGGSETGGKNGAYDYQTKSVKQGINIYVEDFSYTTVTINGSIFGSGNYSSASGRSNIYIKNWGSLNNPKVFNSIQRADYVYLDNSAVRLSGASDVTNKFNRVNYSFNNILYLVMGNASTIYTSAQANLLQNLYSINGNITYDPADGGAENSFGTLSSINYTDGNTITVDEDEKTIVNSVNGNSGANKVNRLYLLNNRGLNILKTEEVGDKFGNVWGMTFLGVYTVNNGTVSTSYYGSNHGLNSSGSGFTDQDFSAYVLGGNRVTGENNMNYYQHGFFTNTYYDNDGTEAARIYTTVINPTPENQAYYYWNIGVPSIIMELDLTASKYVRSGMKSVSMYQFSGYDHVSFDIAAVDVSGLTTESYFMNPATIPTIADTDADALKNFGLSIETSESGWINEGYTYITSDYNGGNRTKAINGTIKYDTSGAEDIPKFIFNVENSRNIKQGIDLGTIVVTINAHAYMSDDLTTPVNSTIKLYVNLDTWFYPDDDYESAMAPGKYYKSFLSTSTNITTTSSFSTYYNMYAYDKDIYAAARDKYPNTDIDHVLFTSYLLPAGTRITMLDISTDDPKYYYYDVTGNETLDSKTHSKYNDQTDTFYAYPLSWFVAMDSTNGNNNYDEAYNQSRYVVPDGSVNSTVEQFIFMVDFANVTNHTDTIPIIGEEFYLGIRSKDRTTGAFDVFSYPMSETMKDMNFSIYNATDSSFDLDVKNAPSESDIVYVDDVFDFDADVKVTQKVISDGENGSLIVRNTSFYQDRLGLRIGLYRVTEDENHNERFTLVTGDELSGAIFYVDGVGYAPGSNGFIRLKLADYVVKINKSVQVDLSNAANLTSGLYEFRVTAFASSDGLYAKQGDTVTNSMDSFRVNLVNENYGLLSSIDDDSDVIVYSNGKTSGGHDKIGVTVNYFGSYTNPNVRISLKRRDYTTVNSYTYNDVNIADYFDVSNITFTDTSQLNVTGLFDNNTLTIKKEALLNHLNSGNMGAYNMTFKLKNSATPYVTGTYRLVFTLYNGDREIGDVYSYIVIKD